MVLLPITDPWNVMINNRVIKIIITVLNTAGHLRDSGVIRAKILKCMLQTYICTFRRYRLHLDIQERDPTTGFAQTAMKHGVPRIYSCVTSEGNIYIR